MNTGQQRVKAAMALLDHQVDGGGHVDEHVIAEMLHVADAILLNALPSMIDTNGVQWVAWDTLREIIHV